MYSWRFPGTLVGALFKLPNSLFNLTNLGYGIIGWQFFLYTIHKKKIETFLS